MFRSFFRRAICDVSRGRRFSSQGPREHREPLETPFSRQAQDNVLDPQLDLSSTHPLVAQALSFENASQADLRTAARRKTVQEFQRSPSDTGSPEVQVAVLTERIRSLTEHMKVFRQDKNSERSLVQLVHKRRSMMQYLLKKNPDKYVEIAGRLGLRETTVFSKDIGVRGAKNKPSPVLRRGD